MKHLLLALLFAAGTPRAAWNNGVSWTGGLSRRALPHTFMIGTAPVFVAMVAPAPRQKRARPDRVTLAPAGYEVSERTSLRVRKRSS